jgi:hypothetical protein
MNLSNWHLVRILQLVFGVVLTASWLFGDGDGFTLALGGILLVQAFFNIGCPMAACATPSGKYRADSAAAAKEEVIYEEITGAEKGK